MKRYNWENLNRQQVGAYSEYFVKMEFTMYGFQVYSPEVDNRGIDFIVRYEDGPFISVQVKSIRDTGYVFAQKEKFKLSGYLYLALVILEEEKEPKLFLIPSEAWKEPNDLLVDRDYKESKSKPEWGVNVSKKNMELLKEYTFHQMVEKLVNKKA